MSAQLERQPVLQRPPYELASWGQRFSAALIDLAINLVPAVAVFWVLDQWSLTHGHFLLHASFTDGYDRHFYGLNPFGLIAWLLIVSLSWGVLMGRTGAENGQTIGMRRTGVRVVADDGYELTGARALVRFLIQTVLLVLFVIPGLLDALWALVDSENRAWHDLVCRTHLVRVDRTRPMWRP